MENLQEADTHLIATSTAGDRTTAPWCVYVPSFGS